MTAARESILLPVVFLTVLALGGVHVAGTTVFLLPTPYDLILGLLLVRVIVTSRALTAESLVSSARTGLANLNGCAVLATLWMSAAQVLAAVTPDSGVPRLAISVFLLILLMNTAAASPDRERMLRSLALTLGSAFILKFVVLQTMSSPGEAAAKRALLALVDGVTAGVLIQEPLRPVTAYVAFFSLGLFLVGVFLLPHRRISPDHALTRRVVEVSLE